MKRTARVNFADATPPAAPSSAREWSPSQLAIFNWFEYGTGNLIARARAGTGKTTTLVEGVSRAPERQILLAAFNKDIALELQSRVRNSRVECKTLHGLGFKYIRRNWQVKVEESHERDKRAEGLARRAAPTAPDVVVRIIRDLHTKAREIAPLAACGADVEEIAVRFNLVPDEQWESEGWGVREVCDAAHRAMNFARERTGTIDFADMIFLPLAHRWVRPWYDLVCVDEAQDMTPAQLMIAVGACRRTGRICIVGDDRQAIYGFRGADVGGLDRLKEELRATELGLTTTYRCAQSIVDLAAAIVPDYTAAPGAASGEIVRRDLDDAVAEMREGDFVISRTNAPLVSICLSLLKGGVRARIKGRDIGRGIIALIRKLKCVSVADVADRLAAHVDREMRAAAKLSDKAREAREEFIQDQAAVILSLTDGAATMSEVEARVNELFSDDVGRGAVTLSTTHRVKGLETDRTFLLESTFRHGKLEEDNLRYVAITRAKTRLCWVTSC